MNYAYGAYNEDLPENMQVEDEPAPILPNIFIWQIPDEDIEPVDTTLDEPENETANENGPTGNTSETSPTKVSKNASWLRLY